MTAIRYAILIGGTFLACLILAQPFVAAVR